MDLHQSDLARCGELLPTVSRTFALSIRVLPGGLRHPVTVAYLLCRIADVLEDATRIDPRERIDGLESLARALADPAADAARLACALNDAAALPLADPQGMRLFREREVIFRAFVGLPGPERRIISQWIQAMALGMSSFVGRELKRAAEAPSHPTGRVRHVLETAEELRSYAYYVAGTVGHLLTELFTLHLGADGRGRGERLRRLAVPFGLGLQFTNIVQDLAEDGRRGWSYIPEELAHRHGITARDLTDPGKRPAALRVVGDMVREAARYLDHAMEFTLLLPRTAPRIRLFCLWPTFFAVKTLVRVWGEDEVLEGRRKVRISRAEVRRVVGETSAFCLFNRPLEKLYDRERRRLDHRIASCPI
jgi:farnesyl-diphosphate farnesyltransferase